MRSIVLAGKSFIYTAAGYLIRSPMRDSLGNSLVGSPGRKGGHFMLMNANGKVFDSNDHPGMNANPFGFITTVFLLGNNKFIALNGKAALLFSCVNYKVLASYAHPRIYFNAHGPYVQLDSTIINTNTENIEHLPLPNLYMTSYEERGWVCVDPMGKTYTKWGGVDGLSIVDISTGIAKIVQFKGRPCGYLPHFIASGCFDIYQNFVIVEGTLKVVRNPYCKYYVLKQVHCVDGLEIWKFVNKMSKAGQINE